MFSKLPIWAISLFAGVLALVLVFTGLLVFAPQRGVAAGEVISSGQPAVGGPFTLTAHTGEVVTNEDFVGRPMLVYFGFTYCPDICPFSLQIISAALDMLPEEDAAYFQPVLITVDPQRDTVEQLALYVESEAFPDNLIGLTGTEDQIAAVAAAYRVVYGRVQEEGAEPDDYTMEHTSIIYLMDEAGVLSSVYTHGTPPQRLAEGLQDFLEESRP